MTVFVDWKGIGLNETQEKIDPGRVEGGGPLTKTKGGGYQSRTLPKEETLQRKELPR